MLIVLRGPSGCGKSTTASLLRAAYAGGRGLAIVRLSERASVVNAPDLLLYVANMYVTQPSFPHGGEGNAASKYSWAGISTLGRRHEPMNG